MEDDTNENANQAQSQTWIFSFAGVSLDDFTEELNL